MVTVTAIEFQGSLMPWSAITELATWCKWSHVVLVLSTGEVIDASPLYGVKIRRQTKKNEELGIWWSKTYDLTKTYTEKERNEMYVKALSQVGKSYDWSWIFGYAFNKRNWQDDEDWVCFEFVSWVMYPWLRVDKNLQRVTGRHLEEAIEKRGL